MDRFNELQKGQILALAQETESILRQFVSAFEKQSTNKFEGYDAGILFQYVFDKVVEITYKAIIDMEIDTQFIPSEPFEYHEPDLPEYIQLKLTNAIGKVGHTQVQLINATLGGRGKRENKTRTREGNFTSCSSLKNDYLCP